MKVYILFYQATVESGSGYEEVGTVAGVFSSLEAAQRVADEKEASMTRLQKEYCWYEVQEHEVK